MTLELQIALKRYTQWFGSYKTSGELKKTQAWGLKNGALAIAGLMTASIWAQKIVRTMP
jgi:hypothetical protein